MIDKRLFEFTDKKPLILLVAFRLGQLGLSIGMWLLLAWSVSGLMTGNLPQQGPWFLAGGILMGVAGKALLHYLMEQQLFDSSARLRLSLRQQVMEKAFRLGDSEDQLAPSVLSQLAVDSIEQIEIYYARFLPQLFYCLLASLIIFFTLLQFAWQPAVVLLIGIPLIPIVIMAVMKIAKKILSKYWGDYTNLGTRFYENLQGFRVLKAFDYDEIKEKEMVKEAEGFRKITMSLLSMQLNSITIMDLISYGGAGLGIGFALKAYAARQTDLLGLLVFLLLSAEVFIPMRQLGSLFHVAMNGISGVSRLFKYLELPEQVYGDETLAEPLTEIRGVGLQFSYDGQQPAVSAIDLTLTKGSFTAFVGGSGSGKSTLGRLLAGRFGNWQGELLWNGRELTAFTRATLRDKAVIIDSHTYLYPMTIKENLLLGLSEAGRTELSANPIELEARLWQALEQVSLAAEVQKMPQQLETPLTENGDNLSGGQRQRLLVAQGLLREADFYLFDEITSGVDAVSEEQLLLTIRQLAKDKVVLFISHRLYNVLAADRVFVLNNGLLQEQGTPTQLQEAAGFFKDYFAQEQAVLGGAATYEK